MANPKSMSKEIPDSIKRKDVKSGSIMMSYELDMNSSKAIARD